MKSLNESYQLSPSLSLVNTLVLVQTKKTQRSRQFYLYFTKGPDSFLVYFVVSTFSKLFIFYGGCFFFIPNYYSIYVISGSSDSVWVGEPVCRQVVHRTHSQLQRKTNWVHFKNVVDCVILCGFVSGNFRFNPETKGQQSWHTKSN